MIGLPVTMKQTIESLGVLGRAVIVGLSQMPLEIHPYQTLIGYEAEIIGANDHLLQELPLLIDMARRHEFSRLGDRPALTFEKVERLSQSRPL